MESSPLTLAELVAKDGPAWVFVLAIIGLLIWTVYKLLNIYENNSERTISSREEVNRISGQMVSQMERSNAVLEAVEKQLSLMNAVNDTLINTLAKSQDRSASMAESVKVMADRVEQMYNKVILEH